MLCIAIDLKGFGFSTAKSTKIKKFDDYVEDINLLIKKVFPTINNFYLLGVNTGAAVAI